ncbi:MAG: hypothetical protein HY998_06895 [candidate division NC10 bacterium]|nr:hypothetical protein [candidate division NC10 bacterium]
MTSQGEESARENWVYRPVSTISPLASQRLAAEAAKKGVNMLDAPVSGGEEGAIEGTLSIMVGGDRDAFERCFPIFQALGKRIVYMGGSGAGGFTKLANQVIVGITKGKGGMDHSGIITLLEELAQIQVRKGI